MFFSYALIWFLLGIAFFVTELIFPGFILFFFGIGSWCAAAAQAAVDLPLTTQAIIFLVSSLLALILLRSWLRSVFLGGISEESESLMKEDSVAATGVVIAAIAPPAVGRVKYGGSFWQAAADEPIAENAVVHIVEKKGLILKVRAIGKEEAK